MARNKIIEVENLVKTYRNNFTAVDDISFYVEEGEIFGLLGPNGAGKTTTLEIIETLREKTEGEIRVAGYDIEKDPKKIKSLIGVQLQSAGFYPRLKLTEIILLFAGLYNVKVRPLDVLKKVGLEEKAKESIEKLSGGQKQRLSIATTLVHTPKIIFLDEPTTGLDPQARQNLWELIKEIRENGTTVVITTHYMDEAEELCDRIAIMDHGKILNIDTPENMIDDLLASGFKKPKATKEANLEDVFLNMTGRELRE